MYSDDNFGDICLIICSDDIVFDVYKIFIDVFVYYIWEIYNGDCKVDVWNSFV